MTTAIKNAAASAGKNPRLYGTHSMHSGGATEMCRPPRDKTLRTMEVGLLRAVYKDGRRDNIQLIIEDGRYRPYSSGKDGYTPINGATPRRTPRLEFLTALNILTTAPKRAI
ncbi:hypothetical protein PHMEG_00010770 [Phytophthora megakarya]|uniref:Uncharacterized protein n=1 Tax=Phytophthora megakarya TaxID=4795 RepID=A0A225WCW6_9STRA|nr:hypothetical protein PHMEG_00010770 [Phytophthora megakarya]